MKTRLLKRLRKEAKNKIFLYPYEGKENEVIVVDKTCNDFFSEVYYSKSYLLESDWEYVNKDISLDTSYYINICYRPFTLDEGIKVVKELRIDYIRCELNYIRYCRHEKRMECKDKVLIKKLKSI